MAYYLALIKNFLDLFIVGSIVIFSSPSLLIADDVMKQTHLNAVSFEILGRGYFYSVNFDRELIKDLRLGVGFGYAEVRHIMEFSAVPIYTNYYFPIDASASWFTTAGYTLAGRTLTLADMLANREGGFLVGGGYEYRFENQFLLRITPYLTLTHLPSKDRSFRPWLGVSLGSVF